MNKKQGILIGIALVLLFAGIALATPSTSSDVIICAFDQNPAGSDKGNEWVTLHKECWLRYTQLGEGDKYRNN